MSDTVLGWLFGGWSFGRSPNQPGPGRVRTTRLEDHEVREGLVARETDGDRLDDRLVAHVRAGDAAAFEAVYRNLAPSLVQFAIRYVRSRDVAEDVVHDVFHTFWTHRTTMDIRTSIAAYLYGAVRFRALRVRREHVRDETLSAQIGADVTSVPIPSTDAAAHAAAFEQAVWAILERTRPPGRDVLYLRWAHGMDYNDIAATLGISAAAARQHVHRLLQRLGPRFRRLTE